MGGENTTGVAYISEKKRWIGCVMMGLLLGFPLYGHQGHSDVAFRSAGLHVAANDDGGEDIGEVMHDAEQGIQNARRLLPVAKKLAIDALRDCQNRMGITNAQQASIEKSINAIDSVGIDITLGDLAEVDDQHPTQIMVGPDYASLLTSDDEVMMLLGHEMTHIAARNERLKSFIDMVTLTVERATGVFPTDDQKEDLAADYIGEQTMRQYIIQYPTDETAASRLERVLGVEPDAGDVFDDGGDDEHLAHIQMVQAWLALDSSLSPIALK